jgi:hypothetical protein
MVCGQLHALATLPRYLWIGGWIGHRVSLRPLEKRSLSLRGIGLTWLITFGRGGGGGGGQNWPWVVGTSPNSQVRKKGKIGLNQSLIYIHPFTPLSPQYLLFDCLQLSSQKNFLGWKNTGNTFAPPPHLRPPLTSYAYTAGIKLWFLGYLADSLVTIQTMLKLHKLIKNKIVF